MRTKLFIILTFFIVDCFVIQSEILEKDILIKNNQIELPGTLSYTKSSEKLIIWIHGSGNVDRNGNQGAQAKANYIKQFRDEINKNDIAFFSYDKRTSNPKNVAFLKGIILDDFADDAKKVIEHFKKESQFKEIILIGHSQGSLVAILASKGVHKYISLAGPSETIDKTLTKQIMAQSTEYGKMTESYFKELKETGDVKNVDPNLLQFFAKPNLPFFRNWMSYNPTKEINKLKIPTLIINGTKDIQVSIEDAKALNVANNTSEIKIIENMNHVLKHIEKDSDNMNSYYSPDFKISSELVKIITEFVKR
tara:strand:+ start:26823 stop:27746 length:924 start_codon:yes stop_codon:yes gene_type:complete